MSKSRNTALSSIFTHQINFHVNFTNLNFEKNCCIVLLLSSYNESGILSLGLGFRSFMLTAFSQCFGALTVNTIALFPNKIHE